MNKERKVKGFTLREKERVERKEEKSMTRVTCEP